MLMIYQILDYLLTLLRYVIIVQAILSWLIAFNIINLHSGAVQTISQALTTMTEPIYRPIRKALPDFGPLDMSPIVVLILLYILQAIILPGIFRPFIQLGYTV